MGLEKSGNVIFMRRADGFNFNPETAKDNAYQDEASEMSKQQRDSLVEKAKLQHAGLVNALLAYGVRVVLAKGDPTKPDSIFLNNWFTSLKADKNKKDRVILCPMSTGRQGESIEGVMDSLGDVLDWRNENQKAEKYLEGTGSLVLDRANKILYACVSHRADKELINKWSEEAEYKPIIFNAVDKDKIAIYHTNVMMWVGSRVAGVCLDAIKDLAERNNVKQSLENNGKQVINLTQDQVASLAGNMFEVTNKLGQKIIAMSDSAWNSLGKEQQELLNGLYEKRVLRVPFDAVETLGGGGVRCCMSEIDSSLAPDVVELKLTEALKSKGELVSPGVILSVEKEPDKIIGKPEIISVRV